MNDKFLGLGLFNIVGLLLVFWVATVLLKVALNKRPVSGLTEFVNTI